MNYTAKASNKGDFWLTQGLDDVAVQKSADFVPLNHHILNYSNS